jgi:hypothetical protein
MRKSIALLIALLFLTLPISALAAIATDAVGQTSCTGTFSSCTLSFTVTGSNTLLIVGAVANSGTPNISGATYNGVAMTAGTKAQTFAYPFYLVGASTGTNNIIVSCSGNCSGAMRIVASSYTGVAQSGQPDAATQCTDASNAMSFTCALTTMANNSWIIVYASNDNGGTTSSGSGVFTLREANVGDSSWALFDTNAAVTPAGSKTVTVNSSTSVHIGISMISFSPAGTVTTPQTQICLFNICFFQ